MAYHKIFVALAHGDSTDTVFAKALELAQQDQAQLMLFHCIPLESQSFNAYPSFYGEDAIRFSQTIQTHIEQQEAQTRDWLSELASKAQQAGVPCEWDWKVGEAGRWIRDIAKNWQADLVIVGRRGLRGMAELFLGSVSSYVVHHAPCSVLVVQQPDNA
ncbi:MAG: universal stress protein [Synechocystis sp.]|jgi:nucleotide-binding universal stress UspA family protein|nr:universal stress protein [Synechocystis sp.]